MTGRTGRNASPRLLESIRDGLVIRDYPLNLGRFSQYNIGAGWSLNYTAATGSLTISTDGTTPGDWTDVAQTGPLLVLPVELDSNCITPQCLLIEAHISYTEATADGVGIGLGVLSADSATPTTWASRMDTRDGSGTLEIRDAGDLQTTVRNTGQTFRGGQYFRSVGPGLRTAGHYLPGTPGTNSNNQNLGAAFTAGFSGGSVYLGIFVRGPAIAGSVTITQLRIGTICIPAL